MTLSLRKARLHAVIPMIAMNLAIFVGGAVWLYGEYDDKQITAQATLAALARSAALNVAKTYGGNTTWLRQQHQNLTAMPATVPMPQAVQVLWGDLRQGPVGQSPQSDVADRDYARAMDEIDAGAAFAGIPLVDPATGTPQWPLALKLPPQDNGWRGLVRMLSVEDVMRPLESARIKPDGMAWIARADGTIIAMAPWRADMIGRDLATLDPGLGRYSSPERILRASLDDQSLLISMASVADSALRVAIAVPESVIFIDWWREAGLLFLLLLTMALGSLHAGRRQWLLLGQLHSLNETLRNEVQSQNAVLASEIKERQEHEKLARVLGNALEFSGTMVLISDATGAIEYANPAFFRATGYQLDDIVGYQPSILRHRDLSPPASALWPTLHEGQTWTGMFCNRRKDGSPLWVSATISPVKDDAGITTHFVAVEEDATNRRHGEEELRQAKSEAEAASLAKSEFLSSMSHELRTPMNAILGFAQLLVNSDRGDLGERQKFYADSILKSGNHLLTLVNDILDMARIEAGRLSLSFERVMPDQIMAEIMPMIATLAERRKITLKDEVSGRDAPILEADFTRIKQVLINLATNAIKYNRSGGTVRFAVSHGDSGPVRISVSDTGIGIPEKRKDEVFAPFARLGAEASMVEGTGIGLTISKMLVEAMGGKIGFFSQENQGTTFWLEIPRAARQCCDTAPAEAANVSLSSANTCQHTLLYIEDNPSNLELMEEIIAQDPGCNCQLLTADTAEQGLTMAFQHQPDLVIMDINLPGINGIEAVLRMKADPRLRSIPVIALSADVMPDTIRAGMKAGFLRYLRKPLDIAEFRKILRQLGDRQ